MSTRVYLLIQIRGGRHRALFRVPAPSWRWALSLIELTFADEHEQGDEYLDISPYRKIA